MRVALRLLLGLVGIAVGASACDESIAPTLEPASSPTPADTFDAGAAATTTEDHDASDAVAPRPSLRILFIGNSYTYVNDVPGILYRIAATAGAGPTIATDEVVAGGATLHSHWSDGIAQTRIAERTWTHVVLQGQSYEPTGSANGDFLTYAKQFGDLITQAGARTTWFVTWARERGEFPPSIADHSVQRMQDELTSAYATAARSVPNSLLACVGEAFRKSLHDHPEIVLHDPDHSHASLAGSYLAAATFYVALADAPVPATSALPDGLDPAFAAALREAANVGSNCADVRAPGDVRLYGEGFHQDDFGNPAEYGDFGTSAMPVVRHFYVENSGVADVDLGVPTLITPFGWTSGSFPGGVGLDPIIGVPFCTTALRPAAVCALSLRFDGASNTNSVMTIPLRNAYQTEVVAGLRGRTTSRAHLRVFREAPSTMKSVPAGISTEFHAIVTNDGATAASAIVDTVDPADPFEWSGNGVFPGGTGSISVDGATLAHCTDSLAVGESCVLTFRVTAPKEYVFYGMPLELSYASASSADAGSVVDRVRAKLTVRSYLVLP